MTTLTTLDNLETKVSFTELFQAEDLENLIRAVEVFAHKAFKNKNSTDWRELQFMLFDMNLRLMQNGYRLGTSYSLSEWVIRDTIERIERQYQQQEHISSKLKNLEVFMPWLKERISTHRVNHHPLFVLFDNDDLNSEEIRYFLANYRVNM
ncbi:hypothetical protein LC605_21605 [Nostoc sp. CHAB 5836]|uniref:hypothetical protein n=1 Tax=Nostoc sp. CHAB 5836 TaxID=2780404 RepID=UPI001E63DF71|nr:hypothetical protein [Nostoc sp. CHAB 5836]MCC5617638.1 hypothetical protein [Nostoc sp. CHAB 5836]